MEFFNDAVLFVFGLFFDILAVAVTIALIVAVGKIVLSIVGGLLGYAWESIHKPSFEKFQAKFKQKKVKK
jgi:hypothetical protein